jgi:xylan 1,4-beta-xylosidase
MIRFVGAIAVAAMCCLVVPALSGENGVAATIGSTYTAVVDASKDLGALDHFWSRAAGNGNARLQAQQDMRTHLKWCHDAWGMQYTIHHGLLNDSMHIYREDASGNPSYNWKMFDSCYDYTIKDLGMRAHFTFFPMPHDLAASLSKTGFVFNGVPCYLSMPKDLNKWKGLCAAIAQHVVDRYGIGVARQCYFRVWNENDIGGFTLGTMDDWQHVYDYAVEGVKSVDSLLKVGGPSISGPNATTLGNFLDHCRTANYANSSKHSTAVDFISFHSYASGNNDPSLSNLGGIVSGLNTVKGLLQSRGLLGKVPIHITEYGASWARNFNNPTGSGLTEPYGKHDSQTAAAFFAYEVSNIIYDWNNVGIGVNNAAVMPPILSYWVMSDVFDEDGVIMKDFINCHGQITRKNWIKKPSFNAFAMMNMLGDRLLPLSHSSPGDTVKGIATLKSSDGSVQVMLFNCAKNNVTAFIDHPVKLTVNNVISPSGTVKYELYAVDKVHSNSFSVWDRIGRPEPMTQAQIDSCKAHQELEKIKSVDAYQLTNKSFSDSIYLPGQSVALAVLTPPPQVGIRERHALDAEVSVSVFAPKKMRIVDGQLFIPPQMYKDAHELRLYSPRGELLGVVWPKACVGYGNGPVAVSKKVANGIVIVTGR